MCPLCRTHLPHYEEGLTLLEMEGFCCPGIPYHRGQWWALTDWGKISFFIAIVPWSCSRRCCVLWLLSEQSFQPGLSPSIIHLSQNSSWALTAKLDVLCLCTRSSWSVWCGCYEAECGGDTHCKWVFVFFQTCAVGRLTHDSLCTQHLQEIHLLIQAYRLDTKMLSRNDLNWSIRGCLCFDSVSTLAIMSTTCLPWVAIDSAGLFVLVNLRISMKTRCAVWSKFSWVNKCSLCSIHLVIIQQTISNGNAFTGHLVKIKSHF